MLHTRPLLFFALSYYFFFRFFYFFFFSSRRRHTRLQGDWSSDVCSSDLRSCRGRTYRSFISSRVKRRPELTRRSRFIRESSSCLLPARAVNCSSHSRNAAFRVLRCERATRRACSIRSLSALSVMFFIRYQCTRNLCHLQGSRNKPTPYFLCSPPCMRTW